MINKKGFIAMSIIYSFFLLFISLILALIAYYLHNYNVLKAINEEVIQKINRGDEYVKLSVIAEVGDYVNYTFEDNVTYSGTFKVLKIVGSKVTIISTQFVNFSYTGTIKAVNYCNSEYISNCATEADDKIKIISNTDLWSDYSSTNLDQTNDLYNLYNFNDKYWVKTLNGYGQVSTNCTRNGGCDAVIKDNPPTYELEYKENIIDQTAGAGIVLTIILDEDVYTYSGNGAINNPYLIEGGYSDE